MSRLTQTLLSSIGLACLVAAGSATAAGLHDPMRPGGARAVVHHKPQQSWHLQSILISPRRRIARINGHSVRVGAHIQGATVLAIKPGAVTLRTPKGTYTLKLFAHKIKSATAAKRSQEQ